MSPVSGEASGSNEINEIENNGLEEVQRYVLMRY